MKKTTILLMAIAFIASSFLTSCESGEKASKLKGYYETESGLIYKFEVKSGDTLHPKVGMFMFVDMTYGPSADSVIFDSRTLPDPDKMQIPMMASVHQGDLYEGLGMMAVGDSAVFVMSADSVFLKLFNMPQIPPEMDSVEYMYFNIKMKEVVTQNELEKRVAEEQKILSESEIFDRDAFLAENFPDATPTATGLYYIPEESGKGKSPVPGDKVSVHYTGKLLNGVEFDSSIPRGKPYDFILGQRQVIAGWDEGIALMKKGGKGTLVVPSDLGYGVRGNQRIPPFSTLVFEVELVDFTKAADLKK